MSRETNLIKNTAILSIGTFFPKVVSIITLPILTGYLTKAEFGTYDLVVTLVSLFLPIITLQIQSAAFRFLIECRDEKEKVDYIVTNIVAFTVPISLVALCILYFVMPGLSPFTKLFVCLYYLFDIFYVTLQQITRGLSFNATYSISAIIVSSFNLLFTVMLIVMGINGILIALSIAYLSGCLILLNKVRKYVNFDVHKISVNQIKELLSYSWPMVFNNLSNWILRLSDRLVITAVLGIEANAVYAVANKIPNLISMLQNTFTLAWQENASLASKDEDARKYYSNIFDNMYGIVSGITALLIAFSPILFKILISGNYADAYTEMSLLFLGIMFCCLSAFQGGIYVAYKRTKQVGITTMLAAACNLIIDLLLVKTIGITAGSLSTLISYFLLLLYRMYDLRKIVTIKYNYKKMAGILILLVIMCILSYRRIVICDIANLIIGVVFFVAINKKLLLAIFQKILKN